MSLKWPRKTLTKILSKSKKKRGNCPASLAISDAFTIHPTNFLRPLLNSNFFVIFNFYFGHKTPCGLKHVKIRPKLLVCVFFSGRTQLFELIKSKNDLRL